MCKGRKSLKTATNHRWRNKQGVVIARGKVLTGRLKFPRREHVNYYNSWKITVNPFVITKICRTGSSHHRLCLNLNNFIRTTIAERNM